MSDFCEIQFTTGSIDEARKISRYLVQEGLVASAQIIPWVESIYIWNNKLETTQESKVVLKTLKSHCKKVEEVIRNNSSYEIPEILFFNIEGGNAEYLAWMTESSSVKEHQ